MTVTINGTTGIDKVQDGVVTSASIADGAVTPTDLSTGKPNWDSSGNFQFNSGYGSAATAYGCRAWVNFNGTGTVAIRASGNVTSITDNGTGNYTVNFTNAMPDINYAAIMTRMANQSTFGGLFGEYSTSATGQNQRLTTSVIVSTNSGGSLNTALDDPGVQVAVFR